MVIFSDWQNLSALIAATGWVKAQAAFHHPPAIVLTTGAAGRLNIDFFTSRLPNIPNVKIMGKAVEGDAPGIPKAIRPNLLFGSWIVEKRIGTRNPIRGTGVDIKAQDLAEQDI